MGNRLADGAKLAGMRRSAFFLIPMLGIACTPTKNVSHESEPVKIPAAPSVQEAASALGITTQPADAASDTVRFVAMGDTGTGEAGQFEVARAVAAKCKAAGCDFVLLLGDNIYPSGAASKDSPDFESKFELPYRDISVDFFVVLGNHDYGGRGLGTDFARGQNEVDYTARSKKWKMPASYYRIERGPLLVVATDSNMQLFGRDEQQRKDVGEWLTKSSAPWKIVAAHHPYRSNGPHGNAGSYNGTPMIPITNGEHVKSFADDIICGRAEIHLSAHDHSRQWLEETCNGTELVVSGTGATATSVGPGNKARFQRATLGFLYVTADSTKLSAEFIDSHGNIEFTRALEKPKTQKSEANLP